MWKKNSDQKILLNERFNYRGSLQTLLQIFYFSSNRNSLQSPNSRTTSFDLEAGLECLPHVASNKLTRRYSDESLLSNPAIYQLSNQQNYQRWLDCDRFIYSFLFYNFTIYATIRTSEIFLKEYVFNALYLKNLNFLPFKTF